jgi:FKBP-type peptidyl-prolyl cis-trans isomerase
MHGRQFSMHNAEMRLWFVVALSLALAACTDSPASPSGTAPFTQTDLLIGTGDTAAVGNAITVNYTGWLYDSTKPEGKGQQFDSTSGGDPLTFELAAGSVIDGWVQGVPGMRIGGVRRLVIPSNLAYGNTRRGPIPPYATLVFDIELVGIEVE